MIIPNLPIFLRAIQNYPSYGEISGGWDHPQHRNITVSLVKKSALQTLELHWYFSHINIYLHTVRKDHFSWYYMCLLHMT